MAKAVSPSPPFGVQTWRRSSRPSACVPYYTEQLGGLVLKIPAAEYVQRDALMYSFDLPCRAI